MDQPYHRLTADSFAALSAGGGGAAAVRELAAAQYSKHLILLAGVLDAAPAGEQRLLARDGYELLAEARRADRTAAETVIGHPSVGSWAQQTLQACRGAPAMPGAEPSGLLNVAAAAAVRAGLTARFEVPASGGAVMLPSLGAASVTGDMAPMRVSGGRAEVGRVEVPADPHQDAPGWRGLRRVRAGTLDLLIDDMDPFRLPGLPDLAPRAAVQPWGAALRGAWQVLESRHPEVAAEVAAGIRVIVPRTTPRSGAVSTTSPQAFGAIGMSLPPGPVVTGETLAHEIQHLKLGALQHIVTLALPDNESRYYAPWREDPRPLSGLFQGSYAYLGVAGFWRRERGSSGSRPRAEVEYARWREATGLGIDTIQSSQRLTTAGQDFVAGMRRALDSWSGDRVPARAQAEADRAARAHLARWQAANGPAATGSAR